MKKVAVILQIERMSDLISIVAAAKSANSKIPASLYLGLLCPIENMKVYGYISNTKIKFLAVVDDSSIKDSQMKHFFSDLHALYVQYISNPFVEPYSELPQDAFDQFILPNFL